MTKVYGLRQQFVRALPLAHVRVVDRVSWLTGAVLVGLFLKVGLLAAGVLPFNSDEAIVALMARHILQGARPAFFYGQAYMGSVDAFLIAGAFSIFGEQIWVIRLVQSLLYAGTLLTTAWLGRKAFGSWQAGALAAWFLAIPTVNVTLYTTVSLGGYGEMLLLGNLILLISISASECLSKREWRKFWWLCLGWGILVGLGLWAFGLTLVYSGPAALYLGWRIAKVWRAAGGRAGRLEGWKVATGLLGFASLGFALGARSWLVYAMQNGLRQLVWELHGSAIAGVEGLVWSQQVVQHLHSLLLLGVPVIFGLRPPWEVRWLVLPLLPFALFFWIAVFVYTIRKLKYSGLSRITGSLTVIPQRPWFRDGRQKSSLHPSTGSRHRSTSGRQAAKPAAFLVAGVGIISLVGFILTP
ncbi:MAG TPA: hypothetical protein VF982_00505, partial [Anaerolineales bacterium]